MFADAKHLSQNDRRKMSIEETREAARRGRGLPQKSFAQEEEERVQKQLMKSGGKVDQSYDPEFIKDRLFLLRHSSRVPIGMEGANDPSTQAARFVTTQQSSNQFARTVKPAKPEFDPARHTFSAVDLKADARAISREGGARQVYQTSTKVHFENDDPVSRMKAAGAMKPAGGYPNKAYNDQINVGATGGFGGVISEDAPDFFYLPYVRHRPRREKDLATQRGRGSFNLNGTAVGLPGQVTHFKPVLDSTRKKGATDEEIGAPPSRGNLASRGSLASRGNPVSRAESRPGTSASNASSFSPSLVAAAKARLKELDRYRDELESLVKHAESRPASHASRAPN